MTTVPTAIKSSTAEITPTSGHQKLSGRQILFKNPVQQAGVNLTVRRGSKWLNICAGTDLSIQRTGDEGKEVAAGVVVGTVSMKFNEIHEGMISLEQDKGCQTIDGLTKAMFDAYPDFQLTDDVTLLFYRVKS